MCTTQEYRTIADNRRRLAAFWDFPWMRDRYLASADKWEYLAQEKSLAGRSDAAPSRRIPLLIR